MTIMRRLLVNSLLLAGAITLQSNLALASDIFYDDFTGPTLDPAWQLLPGQGSYSVGGGQLRYTNDGPTASTTGWNNAALTLALPFTGTNWEIDIEATYNLYWLNGSGGSSGAQGADVLVQFAPGAVGNNYAGTDFALFERNIDAYYNTNSLSASYGSVYNGSLLNPADTAIQNNVADGTYWLRIIRDGGTLTMNYSYDGVDYATAFSTMLADPSSAYNELMLGGITYQGVGSYTNYDYVDITSPAPEPSSFALLSLGTVVILGLVVWSRGELKHCSRRP